ncbi:MAG: hypothetical protein KAT65_05750, partial [Methanophagales archaeon]|nr:hypothetical protein [Methanophagales archaeon]
MGNLNAKLTLIVQALMETEDRKGKMFIGPSGRVLDELLKMATITRGEIHHNNFLKEERIIIKNMRKMKEKGAIAIIPIKGMITSEESAFGL